MSDASPSRRRVGGRRSTRSRLAAVVREPEIAAGVAAEPIAEALASPPAAVGDAEESLRRFAERYPFPLDEFQLQSIRALENRRSVLAAAPTGTGKTVIAEAGIHLAREQGLRVIYTSPIKALSNQKFRDWRALYGEEVGLLTGDVTENPRGSILVMTTEVLRNMLLQTPHVLDDAGVVIFDEVHFLADPERGTTWEEAILYCPKHIRLVCLSATVANADEIATWISHVHRETVLVTHNQRAVPLEHHYYVDDQLYLLIDAEGKTREPLRVGGESRYPRPPGVGRTPREVPRPRDVVHTLGERGMLPAIYFIFGRRACEVSAQDCDGIDLVADRAARRARRDWIEAYLELLEPEDRQLDQVQRLVALLHRGVAFHHAGLLPILKSLVEELFAAGLIGVVFATETLALGINMPARSVVIAEQTKYDGETRRPLLPNEYAQLVGRAGRRGLDPLGYAVVLYSPWMSCAEVMEIATGPLLPIRSSFTPRYNTVASLWDGTVAARDRLVRLFSSSLRQFQMNDALKEAASEVEELRRRAEEAHFACPYPGVPDDAVSEYISLRRQLADARKRLHRAAGEVALVERQYVRPPWAVPSPSQVRREMQLFAGGEVVYVSGTRSPSEEEPVEPVDSQAALAALRPGAWGIFLRRYRGGPGLILIGHAVEAISIWADVTYLPDGRPAVDLPVPLRNVDRPMADVRPLLPPAEWRRLQAALKRLDLPDLPAAEQRKLTAAREQLERRLSSIGQREQEAQADVRSLEEALAGHVCHPCPLRAEHERSLRRELAAVRALGEAEAHAAELEAAAASQAERTLEAITSVQARFGYLVPPQREGAAGFSAAGDGVLQPTEKMAVLSRIYDANGLFLQNLAWGGLLDDFAPAEVMELFSWFSYDREGPRWNRHQLTTRLWDVRSEIARELEPVQRAEEVVGLAITTGPNPAFYGPALAWCRGAAFADLLDKMPLSEGDLLLTLNKTLDLAAQVREALRTGAPHNQNARRLATKLEVGDRLLRRGIVAQSLRLVAGAVSVGAPATEPASAAEVTSESPFQSPESVEESTADYEV